MRAIVLAVLMVVVSGPVHARDAVWVYVGGHGGDRERASGIDLNTLSVCQFKSRMASRFGLDRRKFDVKLGSRVLSDDGTMKEAGVRSNANVYLVKRNTNSHQC